MNLLDGLKSDWIYINGFRRIIGAIGKFDPDAEYTVADAIEDAVDDHDDRLFISFEGQEISYADFEASGRTSLRTGGLSVRAEEGRLVALFMENRPDYIAFWTGMAKIAVKTALINYNLSGAGLAHCINEWTARPS
jgi:fatty-acyl-CoA synthase